MEPALFFIENLTLRAWFLAIWPRLLRKPGFGRHPRKHCNVIDSSRFMLLIARLLAGIVGVAVERLEYRLIDVRDDSGLLIRLRVPFQDLVEVQREAIGDPVFQELERQGLLQDRLPIFLAKKIAGPSLFDPNTMWRALLLTQVSAWKLKQTAGKKAVALLFLESRPWLKAIGRYAAGYNLTVIPVPRALNARGALRRSVPGIVVAVVRFLHYRASWKSLLFAKGQTHAEPAATSRRETPTVAQESGVPEHGSRPRVAVGYSGQLNLNQPERHSDLFFCHSPYLSGDDVLVTFASPGRPLDEAIWAELKEHGMGAVALHPGASKIPALRAFTPSHNPARARASKLSVAARGLESRWVNQQIGDYQMLRNYWAELSAAYNIKVFVTWYKYDATHCAIADGLQASGGVTAIYQRAYEPHPSPATTIGADIGFGFSQTAAEVERLSDSMIRYHVTTGYLGDHRFPLLRDSANTVRQRLRQNGAKYIVAFFDENSADDDRWHTGHQFMRENYDFLLEKVLAEPWFGLVLKPKTPRSLLSRLDQIADKLQLAVATGRCFVYEEGTVQGDHPPCEAALAADIAVHGHLCAATAGVEAALAGIPTLLMDREGWAVSPLYRLGVGRVVFTDWESLWEACLQHWSHPRGPSGFGDWSCILDELDPFRDGRGAERMGTFIHNLLEGFQAGLGRETVMADTAERYCKMWGSDKITEVNSGLKRPLSADGGLQHQAQNLAQSHQA